MTFARDMWGGEGAGARAKEPQGADAPVPATGSAAMFVFFSSRLGCLGSIVASAVLTLIALALFGVF